MSLPVDYIGSIASSQTREFFRPKTPFERIQLIFSLSWFLIAFLGTIELQAYLFFGIIVLMVLNYSYFTLFRKPGSTFLNTVAKFTFFFVLFLFFKPEYSPIPLTFFTINITDILLVQKSVIAVLLIIGLFMKYIRLELLKPTSRKKLVTNYTDFSFQLIKGIGYSIYLLVLFDLLNWIPSLASKGSTFPNPQDTLLIIGSLLIMISSQAPEGKDLRNLFAKELLLVSETRFERARDSILKVSIFLLFFVKIIPFFTSTHLVFEPQWTDAATLLFVIGIITFVLAFFEPKDSNRGKLSQMSNNLSGKVNELLPDKLALLDKSMNDVSIKPDTQFFKLNDDFPLIDKVNTKFIAKKNSVAIPVKTTPEGTAVVFVGESDIENISDKGIATKEKIEDLATAIIVPNDVWNKANLALEAIKPSDETIKALSLKGIETKEKLLELAQSTLSDFKNIANTTLVKQQFQGVLDNFQQGKYFVSDTKKGTIVRLPGITVIDQKDTTFVRVFGIKVLESQGYTVVNMPFIKVIETPDYQLVNLPGINVIEAGKSNLVNLMGFQILDGDRQEIENARARIERESLQLDSAFLQLDNRINSVLSNPDSFLLARDTSGKKIELLTGKESDKALVSSDLLSLSAPGFSLNTNSDQIFETKKKSKVKADKIIKSSEIMDENSSFDISDDIDLKGIDSDSPNYKKLEKFYRIAKMSHKSIDLDRLAKHLDFTSVSDLESWLIEQDIPHLLINWEERKITINDDLLRGLKRTLRKSR